MKRQEGQALVLACLLMLILSIALITTVNIGHGVHERIRLQNTADAAAYSTAAMEARAFNFYAFTNRTQVSHYVSAMMWQSLDSFLFSIQAFLTDIFGFMRTVGPCFPSDSRSSYWIIVCAVLDNLAYLFSAVFDAARWPIQVFQGFWRILFTLVIPLALMTTYPAMAMLGRLEGRTALAALGGALLFAAVSRFLWRAAIRSYTSASS